MVNKILKNPICLFFYLEIKLIDSQQSAGQIVSVCI
jgi:hypothetical protein